MACICAFVFNTVVRDSRVLKEADSLTAAGHEVIIIGLTDRDHPETELVLDNGVKVQRVSSADISASMTDVSTWKKNLKEFIWFLHFPVLTVAIGYLAFVGVTGTVEEKITLLVDGAIVGVVGAAVYYLFASTPRFLSSAIRLSQSAIVDGLGAVIGPQKAERLYWRFKEAVIRLAPLAVQSEIARRAAVRVKHMVALAEPLRPDIAHCHDIHTLPVGAELKRRTGCRVIYDAHEIYEEIAQSVQAATDHYRFLHTTHASSVDGFITINESIAGWYREKYPSLPRATIVMNATVPHPFNKYDGRLHDAADLPISERILLYQGGYARKRGLEALVRAAEFLPSGWTLVMMGWGRLEDRLRSLAAEVNVARSTASQPDAIRFVPAAPQAELPLWSAGGSIGIIPYENVGLNHWFCTPNKLWEYPNAGVPVLVSPFPELRKPVETYKYGWLLGDDDAPPAALGAQIEALSDDEIARAKAACETFIEQENWSKFEERLLALYDEILVSPSHRMSREIEDDLTVDAEISRPTRAASG